MTAILQGGFDRAPQESATAFRAALSAMARPGKIETVTVGQGPAPLSAAASVLLLTLCDAETPVHLAPSHDTNDIRNWIIFHTNAPIVAADKAMFAVGTWDALGPKEIYAQGTSEYPDRSATLIVEMDSLATTGATLSGPGIKDTVQLPHPDPDFAARNRAKFPLGLDLFLTHGAQLAGVPRTTKVV